MTTNEASKVIGQRVRYMAQRLAADVVVLDVREAYGRRDYLVRDCAGREIWVAAGGCTLIGEERGGQ